MRLPRAVPIAPSLSLAAFTVTASADTIVDDFEAPDSIADRTLTNGPEFSGAFGSIQSTVGHIRTGLQITDDFTGGGNR